MTTLIFVRHGETAWSKDRDFRFRGRIDVPLNTFGLQQAKATGARLKDENITSVYSSPLSRARATAAEIAKPHDLPVLDHTGFIDLNFGSFQGALHQELRKTEPEMYSKWQLAPHKLIFPGGESLEIVRKRVEEAISDIINRHKNETVVISTHGAVLRIILCILHGVDNDAYWSFNIDNCAFVVAKYENNGFTILAENENTHLNEIKKLRAKN
jgi:broad specificity phosphatase PhoE